MNTFNSPEFEFIKTTLNKLLYGKWYKCYTARFSWCLTLRYFVIYVPWIFLSISSDFMGKLANLSAASVTSNQNSLLILQIMLSVTVFSFFFISLYIVSFRYYSIKNMSPECFQLIEDNYRISQYLQNYKFIFSFGVKYNRIAFLVAVTLGFVVFTFINNPIPDIIIFLRTYFNFSHTDASQSVNIITEFFSKFSDIFKNGFSGFIQYELMLLVPILLPFINTRIKHIVLIIVFQALVTVPVLILTPIAVRDPKQIELLIYILDASQIAFWIAVLCYHYYILHKLNKKMISQQTLKSRPLGTTDRRE